MAFFKLIRNNNIHKTYSTWQNIGWMPMLSTIEYMMIQFPKEPKIEKLTVVFSFIFTKMG